MDLFWEASITTATTHPRFSRTDSTPWDLILFSKGALLNIHINQFTDLRRCSVLSWLFFYEVQSLCPWSLPTGEELVMKIRIQEDVYQKWATDECNGRGGLQFPGWRA